jgi:hypothetical protein
MPSPARKRWKTIDAVTTANIERIAYLPFPPSGVGAGERMRRPQWPRQFYSRNLRAAFAAGLLRIAASQALSLG